MSDPINVHSIHDELAREAAELRQIRLDEFARAALSGIISGPWSLYSRLTADASSLDDEQLLSRRTVTLAYDIAEDMLAESARRAAKEQTP